MKHAHLLAAFYFEPWNIRPDLHANFGRILLADMKGEQTPAAVHARKREPLAAISTSRPIVGPVDPFTGEPLVPQMAAAFGVAVIPVYGVLGKRLATLDLLCGGADYEHIAEFARMALADPTVKTVVLDFDSPGGSCRGLPECFAVLADLAAQKHLVAYTEGLCCSAAYYLACAANELYASPSASVGNIGTILAAVDSSREWELKGWHLELFASGALKGIGFEGKEWTDTEREFFRGWMLKKFDEFKAVVQAGRPQVAEECFDGRWLDGDLAGAFGLVDGVALSLQNVVEAALAAS
jgi:ClpP class serine protease